jgi:RNA polymerase sigma-70 factor (ECF subfamily)
LQIKDSLKAYLHRAIRNTCINHLQKKKLVPIEEQTDRVDHAPSIQQQLQSIDLEKMVQVAISKMPEACRTIFLLRRMDELSLKEIASELNISTKTVENQLTKARKILAQYLKAVLILVLILMTMK